MKNFTKMLKRIPTATVERLSNYLKVLKDFKQRKIKTVSSFQLAKESATNSAQVRKDLAYFGQFGKRGEGYRVTNLQKNLKKILGVNRSWNVALIGIGNLGSALLAYPGFREEGFKISVAFDNSLLKIGKKVEGVEIQDIEKMEEVLRKEKIKIGIIATPLKEAQNVADRLVRGGVKTVLNFAPTSLTVPERVRVRNVDLSRELEVLSFFLMAKKAG